jgi:TetR/AcrR family transcriptional repressor of nem operon
MRYSPEHKQRTRGKILAAAAARFRKAGYRASGVDGIMRAVGLTQGGFYAHFASKQALLGETLAVAFAELRSGLLAGLESASGPELVREVVRRYLSRSHRDDKAGGCPLPVLAAEISREGQPPRRVLAEHLRQLVAELAQRTPAAAGLDAEDRVLATIALCAGALMLARAVPDGELSDRILRAARRLAVPEGERP